MRDGIESPPATPIDYATPPRRRWLRRHARRLVAVALITAIAGTAYTFRRPVEHYVRWQYGHWQLSRYAMSPRDAVASPTTVPTSPTAGTRHLAPPLVSLAAVDSDVAMITGIFSGTMRTMMQQTFPGMPTRGFDYVGQRRRPDGEWRTVVIRLQPEIYQPFNGATIAVIRRPGWFERPSPGRGWQFLLQRSGQALPALVECGEDPADASALVVTLHSFTSNESPGPTFVPARLRARLTDADELDWTLESHDERVKPSMRPFTYNRAMIDKRLP